MPIFSKPYFVVDFNKSICNFEICVNDVPVFKSMDGGSLASHYPINHFILRSGFQEITIRVMPLKGETTLREDSYLKVKVQAYDSETENYSDLNEVFFYQTPNYENKKYPIIEVRDKFEASVPYAIRGWRDSISVKDVSIVEKDAEFFYKRIHHLALTNTNQLFKLFNQKFNEVDEALYLKDDNEKEWQSLLNQLNKEEFVLQPFPKTLKTNLFGYGKIIEMVSVEGYSVLHYKNKEGDEFSLPVLIHRKSEDQDFEIIR